MASILKVDTIQDQDGNNIINENADTITIGASGDTITVPSGATLDLSNATQTGVGGVNTPAFRAYSSSDQSLSSGVTAIQQLGTENFDTDSCYDTSTYRFTPNVAGKYHLYAECNVNVGGTTLQELYIFIVKNNTTSIAQNALDLRSSYFGSDSGKFVSTVEDMNGSTDYVEFRVYCTVSSGSISAVSGTAKRYFGGYKIIE